MAQAAEITPNEEALDVLAIETVDVTPFLTN